MAIIRRSMPRELNIRWAAGDTVPLTFPIGFSHFVLHFFCCASELSRLTTERLFELLFFSNVVAIIPTSSKGQMLK